MPLISTFVSGSSRGFGRGVTPSLYSFASHTFTSGPVTSGRNGPTLGQLQTSYSSSSWAQNTSYFNVVTQGIQLWTVPEDATYQFTVAGARGESGAGLTSGLYGGSGAILQGRVYLTQNTVVSIVVGQIGVNGGSAAGRGGGGGGGSFVYTGAIAGNGLIFAAGGGGGGDDTSVAGQSCNSDLKPRLTGGTIYSNNGLGGAGGYSDGAGWLGVAGLNPTYDGQQWIGGAGNTIGEGGFGGAGGDIDDGGSGGGFTGGSGTTAAGGGAGGSFYAGMVEPDTAYTSIYTVTNYAWGGLNTSNGYVTVTKL